ncbi:MAG: VanZ family protein [Anaerolineales bacterium]
MVKDNERRGLLKVLYFWGPAIAWMGMLFYLSSQPSLPQLEDPWWNTLFRKGGHFGVYALLAWLDLRALAADRQPGRRTYALAWVLAVLYAVIDELHQGLTPGRHPTLKDVVIDAAGATAGLFLAHRRESAREVPAPR